MNKFIQTYINVINEEKFKNSKWKFNRIYKNIEIYENYFHIENRLKLRYNINFYNWPYWNIITNQIINYLILNSSWLLCSKKEPFQKMYIC